MRELAEIASLGEMRRYLQLDELQLAELRLILQQHPEGAGLLNHINDVVRETLEDPKLLNYRYAARKLYEEEGVIEVDACDPVSLVSDDGGAWVAAWLWVSDDEAESPWVDL